MAKKKRAKKKATKKKVRYQLKEGVELKPGFSGWGGYRPGAGRKKSPDSGVSHTPRGVVKKNDRVLVSMNIVDGRPKLLTRETQALLREIFELACKDYFKILEYRVQEHGIHLLVRANDLKSLARGMGGLGSRMSRQLNKHWGSSGTVYADRYEEKVLHTPEEIRKAKRSTGGGGTWKSLS